MWKVNRKTQSVQSVRIWLTAAFVAQSSKAFFPGVRAVDTADTVSTSQLGLKQVLFAQQVVDMLVMVKPQK